MTRIREPYRPRPEAAPGALLAPATVQIVRDRAVFTWGRSPRRADATDLLQDFARLFGQFVPQDKGLDGREAKAFHAPPEFAESVKTFMLKRGALGVGGRYDRGGGSEPLSAWWDYSGQAFALLWAATNPDPPIGWDRDRFHRAITRQLRGWTDFSGLHVTLDWTVYPPRPVWRLTGVLSAVVLEFFKILTGREALALCSCGQPFMPKGRARFCERCRADGKTAARMRKRKSRHLERVRTMAREGRAAAEIARDLGQSQGLIERWLREPPRRAARAARRPRRAGSRSSRPV